ncbi:MAG: LysM peptidoglycan-binding domain-containing protein [Peptococcaceae bacterium]|nr:LysM peptidoglycan-binding domain-containing protein [Peptococcaceae bacterium]
MRKITKTILSAILTVILAVASTLTAWAGAISYRVKSGDTLWGIANRFDASVAEIKQASGVAGDTIHPGRQLTIPGVAQYRVASGDTLWQIARKFNTTVYLLQKMNDLPGSQIYAGQILYVPDKSSSQPAGGYSQADVYWLSRIINAEARGESQLGQIAVGAVILNRVNSPQFPGTIKDVIFQYVNGIPQFSPVEDGTIYMEPTPSAVKAAYSALAGNDPTYGALYFYNPQLTSYHNWVRSRPVTVVIGNHVFAK